jgi:probable HAF family extracellular repeat protein
LGWERRRWDSIIDIGTLGESPIYALSINPLGHAVGFHTLSNGVRAFIFNGSLTNLGNWGGSNSYAFGINSSGRIVGHIDTASGAMAVIYDNGSVTNLGTLGGTNSFAFSINDSNQVAGASLISGNAILNAFVWQHGWLTNLNGVIPIGSGWTLTDARGINDSGFIVGWGVTNSADRAFLLTNGVIVDLGQLPGATNSYALGVNNSNWVVGGSTLTSGMVEAFLWKGGQFTNLNALINPAFGIVLRERLMTLAQLSDGELSGTRSMHWY